MEIKIYSDWACSGNPWPWWRWWVIIIDTQIYQISWKSPNTTNNQMEMEAIIQSMIYICDNILSKQVSQNINNIYKKYLEPVFFGDSMDIQSINLRDDVNITIYTDSKYVYDGINGYIHNWKINGRKTTAKQPVKNQEFWQKIDFWNTIFCPKWIWVKWHATNKYNNLADKLATSKKIV